MSSKTTAAGRSWPGAAAAAAAAAVHGPHPRSRRSLLHRGAHLQLWLLAVVALALLVGPAAGLPNVDISIGPPTAKSASVSYTWGLAASVIPTQVTMAVTEAKPVTWIINATRSAAFTGSLTGSVRIARTLTQTGGISWSAVGISVKQGDKLYLSTNAVCTPGNQFLPMGSSSDQMAQSFAVVNCAFSFGPNLGAGATPFSPSGLDPSLLGEASPNKVFELSANITLSTGTVEQSNVQTFTFDLAGSGIVGECATVRDTWAQVTLPIPLGFSPPTDGVSNPATATGNPPSMQQRVCTASNFAYVMTIPASSPSQRACGDYAFTAAATLNPENSAQGNVGGTSGAQRTARATITGCDAAPGTPGAPPPPLVPVPGAPGVPVVVPPPVPVPPPVVVPPTVVNPVPPVVAPPPAITPAAPPPVVTPVVTPIVTPPPVVPVVQPANPAPGAPAAPPAITPAVPGAPPAAPPPPGAPPAPAASQGQSPNSGSVAPLSGGSSAANNAGPASQSAAAAAAAGEASAAALGPPALASNSSGGVTSDTSSSGTSAPLAPYVAPVVPTAAPQPLAISVTSVGGYQVNRQGSVWSARTSTSPEQLFLRQSARSRLTFTVDYRRTSLTSGAYVMGSITLTNPNAQVVSVPGGLSIKVSGQASGSNRGSNNNNNRQSSSSPTNAQEFQVDCLSGQANARAAVPFKVPSGGSITCTFIIQLPNFSSSRDGGEVTASVGRITLGASDSRGLSAEGSSSERTPWAFAPNPVAPGGECARVTASVQDTNDKLQIVGPAETLSGDVVPAAGRVICSPTTYTFSGDFGPIGSRPGRRCGAQAILTATARPQGVSNSGVASAVSVVGTTVVPIDEPDCQKGGSGATAADDGGDGNPAVQVLQVDVGQLAPTSVTEYAWRVKFAMKPPKEAVKYSENATVKSEVEVTRSVSSVTRRLSGEVTIQNPSDKPFTVLEVRVNATLARRRRRVTAAPAAVSSESGVAMNSGNSGSSNARGSNSGSNGNTGSNSGSSNRGNSNSNSNSGSGSDSSNSGSGTSATKLRVDRTSQNSDPIANLATRGLRRMLRLLLQQATASPSSSTSAASAAAALERAAVANGPAATQQNRGEDSTGELFKVMMGRPGGPPSPSSSSSSSNAARPGSSSSSSSSTPSRAPVRRPVLTGPSVAATVDCPPADKSGGIALPAATRRGGGSNPGSVVCKFTVVLPPNTTLQAAGRVQVVVLAAPASSNGGSSSSNGGSSSSSNGGSGSSSAAGAQGRIRRDETPFNLRDSKARTVGSCARVTVAPAAQPLALNPTNLLKTRALPRPSDQSQSSSRNGGSSRQQQQQQQQQQPPPPRAPEGQKVCDSSSYTFEELVGPVKGDACGNYEVVSLATAEPESSPQAPQKVLASTTVSFNGCGSSTAGAVPSITLKDLKLINFTTYTWTLHQSAVTSSGVALIPASNDTSGAVSSSSSSSSNAGSNADSSSSSSSRPAKATAATATAATAAAASTTTAAVNASASPFLSRTAPGVLVIPAEKDTTESVTLTTQVTRLAGVQNGLFGLEGQVVVSAPGKDPLDVTGVRVAIARPGDESPLLVAAYCPSTNSNSSSSAGSSSSNSSSMVTLPPAPATVTCSFNYTTTSSEAGLVTGVVLLPAAAAADNTPVAADSPATSATSSSSSSSSTADALSPSFLGSSQSFRFAGPDSSAVTKRELGECVTAADVVGMEVKVVEDLIIPPVRAQNEIGLPKPRAADASGKNVSLLPAPKTTKGSGLSDGTKLCESRAVNVTLQFGPFEGGKCGSDSQFFAAARVAPTPVQPKGLTREFVLPLEVQCSSSSSSSGGSGKNGTSGAFFKPRPDQPGGGSSSPESIRRSTAGSGSSSSSSGSNDGIQWQGAEEDDSSAD